jgi:hypothetical protein
MKITTAQAAALINQSNGSFFNVTFVKRTTGELRTLTGRTGVAKYANGTGLGYDRIVHALIGVWCAGEAGGKDAYRSIPVEGITALKISGQSYTVE